MGLRHIIPDIKKRLEEKKEFERESAKETIDKGVTVEVFLGSKEFEMLQEIFASLKSSYEEDAYTNDNLKSLAKAQVFKDIEKELLCIVDEGRTLARINKEEA